MKYLLVIIYLLLNISCKDNYISIPINSKEAKERKALIKEFYGDNSIITINKKKFIIKDVYLTYLIDSKKVHKQAFSLIVKTVDYKTKEDNYPMNFFDFKIKIDTSNYKVYSRSYSLVSDIPKETKTFKLSYFDNKTEKLISFYEKK